MTLTRDLAAFRGIDKGKIVQKTCVFNRFEMSVLQCIQHLVP